MDKKNEMRTLLSPYRVLDLTDGNSYFCNKILDLTQEKFAGYLAYGILE